MPQGLKHRVLLAASEVVGFAKTGGLADVAGSLPRALARRGHECAIILPLYQCTRDGKVPLTRTDRTVTIRLGGRTVVGGLWRATLPDSSVPVYLIAQPEFFPRDDPSRGQGLYQFTLPNGQKQDYSDNCARFIFFSRAVLEAARVLDLRPDVIHCNDWQTGLVPVYLNKEYRKQPGFERTRALFTIHNIAYQGSFWHWDMPLTGLPWEMFNYRELEFYGRLNFLKAGIVFSDMITTVSPSYAQEIQTPYYGCGLEGVLAERRDRLVGIVNGVDYRSWNPATDPHLVATYDVHTVDKGKPACKAWLQRRFGLPVQPATPLLGLVSRLVEQKGLSLVARAAEGFLSDGSQLVVLGEGDAAYHRMLLDLRERYPERVGLTLAFDEPLAHQIEAGADIFLMPSQYEPSGLNQLYSLKYGTVPVVRATGGLADTITDCTPETLAAGTATGFTFLAYTPAVFLETVRRALALHRESRTDWRRLMETAMQQDWSWDRSAAEYERLYSMARAEE
jgi:starch synthase